MELMLTLRLQRLRVFRQQGRDPNRRPVFTKPDKAYLMLPILARS